MDDLISRQTVLDILSIWEKVPGYSEGELNIIRATKYEVENMQSEQPEKLTDKEQRIFLAAMGRETKICKEVDAKMTREPYEDSLVWICKEIERKVKGALWT